jgi:hypothetical protein
VWQNVLVLCTTILLLGALTGVGARRRGYGPGVCLFEAVFFPVAWIIWFIADNRRAGRRSFQGH